MAPINVMLVDDHTLVRQGLGKLLSMEPDIKLVSGASNAQQALKRIKETNPDVVLMDIKMPGSNGIEVTQIIRKLYPDIIVIILTMYVDEDLITQAIQAGAAAYLLKSASQEELVEAIRMVQKGQMILPQQVAISVMHQVENRSKGGSNRLSQREEEILRCLCNGLSNREIATNLHISEATVKSHLHRIYYKLGVRDRTQAISQVLGKNVL